ncbi:MAG TPA: TlpA disulfide reductase family protein [Bryobacteraceae bacterium]|jgi:peroxiredoxin|nr:TlpA disulfide reductase family protein [Bryobacteraceae bacterium]
MRKFCAIVIFAATTFATVALAIPPLPRKSPEFTISPPGGKETLLSSYRGKVVLLGFFATWCQHCQNTAKVFNGLQEAFGSEGLQAIGIAINPEADAAKVTEFKRLYAPSFPVGLSKPDNALSFLQISVMERWVYPQVVLIDRKGMIRAQSDVKGSPELQDVVGLRPEIEKLLKER